MSLKPAPLDSIPQEMARVATAAFPKDSIFLRLNMFSLIYQTSFRHHYPPYPPSFRHRYPPGMHYL